MELRLIEEYNVEESPFVVYTFKSTLRNNWGNILDYAAVLHYYMNDVEIIVKRDVAHKYPVNISSQDDIAKIEKAPCLIVSGFEPIGASQYITFAFYTDTGDIELYAPASFGEHWERADADKVRAIEEFVDWIEVESVRRSAVRNAINGYIEAMKDETKDFFECERMRFPLLRE
jgi:hypothetical protein